VLFLRALLAFLMLPAVVGFMVPWWIAAADRSRTGGWWVGGLVAAAGLVVLLWCVRDFYVSGKGTLAPWDPPKRLVIVGLYRFMRNPMYVGVLTLVAGWSLLAGSAWLAAYGAALAVGFHLRVIWAEEPWLARQFGADWAAYAAAVPRWWPRRTPWSGGPPSART
jgi:protein-S-isoprenylcysteine O-methyltransferase Ste14